MARRDNRKAARALADWARDGFREAVIERITASYEVSPRTLWNWKKALETDKELAGLFRERLNDLLDRSWTDDLDHALRETIYELLRHIKNQPAFTPSSVEAITRAFSALGEVAIAREVLGVAATEQDAATRAPAGTNGGYSTDRLPN